MMLAALASRKWDKTKTEPIPLTGREDGRPSVPTTGSGYYAHMQNASWQAIDFLFNSQEVDYIAITGDTNAQVRVRCGTATREWLASAPSVETPFTGVLYVGQVADRLTIEENTSSRSKVTAVPMRTVTA